VANYPGAGDRVRRVLTSGLGDPDLAGARDPAELEKLSVEERRYCLSMWADAEAAVGRRGH
jgi:hypothetical protein